MVKQIAAVVILSSAIHAWAETRWQLTVRPADDQGKSWNVVAMAGESVTLENPSPRNGFVEEPAPWQLVLRGRDIVLILRSSEIKIGSLLPEGPVKMQNFAARGASDAQDARGEFRRRDPVLTVEAELDPGIESIEHVPFFFPDQQGVLHDEKPSSSVPFRWTRFYLRYEVHRFRIRFADRRSFKFGYMAPETNYWKAEEVNFDRGWGRPDYFERQRNMKKAFLGSPDLPVGFKIKRRISVLCQRLLEVTESFRRPAK